LNIGNFSFFIFAVEASDLQAKPTAASHYLAIPFIFHNLPAGIYILQLKTGNATKAIRLVYSK
jgi:hypothetical protein